ncbi:cytochrome b [Aliikangiella coralliicola]|uniref:Cytochrome b n=1 Tax=Aliikangiella coralliicola TaxID=2592383 RepID=A0A545UJJ1_9GAMM|nr:cytochrome b [Aliikangiella coralliicola]TQV89634.1 cytochrome b [Aliikangiella coralliicola]
MSLRNTESHYGKLTIIMHWLMAAMIIGMIVVGFVMDNMEDGDLKWKIYALHKATGVILLILALFRWYWTLSNKKLQPLESYSQLDIKLAHAGKWFLMLLILLMPVSGLIMSIAAGKSVNMFGLFTIPGLDEKNHQIAGLFHSVHEIAAWIISAVVGLHILFAFKHHWLSKDATLTRMLGKN